MAQKNKISTPKDKKLDTTNPLFSYIKPQDNTIFSTMRATALQELLYDIEHYLLLFRKHLALEDNITFGLELEFEHIKQPIEKLRKMLNKTDTKFSWIIKEDSSLMDGAEINSPILKDTSSSWKDLKKVCHFIEQKAIIGKNSAGHIHIGSHILGDNPTTWLRFLKLWGTYENIIYRFLYGEYLSARINIEKYALPMAQVFLSIVDCLSQYKKITSRNILEEIMTTKNQAINFKNVKSFTQELSYNTIEFRCPNGSDNPIIWQNNVNFLVHLLLYAKSPFYNDHIIERRIRTNDDQYFHLEKYNEIVLPQALELADLIFQNNYDKIYFLRQYLKSFETSTQELEKANTFVKRNKK